MPSDYQWGTQSASRYLMRMGKLHLVDRWMRRPRSSLCGIPANWVVVGIGVSPPPERQCKTCAAVYKKKVMEGTL